MDSQCLKDFLLFMYSFAYFTRCPLVFLHLHLRDLIWLFKYISLNYTMYSVYYFILDHSFAFTGLKFGITLTSLHLFDTVIILLWKYLVNLFLIEYILKCNLLLWFKAELSASLLQSSVLQTWSFRNHLKKQFLLFLLLKTVLLLLRKSHENVLSGFFGE